MRRALALPLASVAIIETAQRPNIHLSKLQSHTPLRKSSNYISKHTLYNNAFFKHLPEQVDYSSRTGSSKGSRHLEHYR